MRARRPKNLQQSYDRFGAWIESDPSSWRGHWRTYGEGSFQKLHLDLGCGKGGYAVEFAIREPNTFVVGIDSDDICIARCAELAGAKEVANCSFCLADASMLTMLFAEHEVDAISINFPTPLPRKKNAEQRLVHARTLALCRELLSERGELRFKTDSKPLFDFSLSQFHNAGFEIVSSSTCYDSQSNDDIETLYEQRAKELGASICMLVGRPCALPAEKHQVSMSLVDYLPDDLDTMTYVPFGMEDTVFNMRNRRAREKRRQNKERA